MKSRLLAALATAMSLMAWAQPTVASSAAITGFSGADFITVGTPDSTRGWSFILSQNVTLEALGGYDLGGNGFVSAHQVAIWESATQNLVAYVTLQAGTGSTLSGAFRYETVGPAILMSGTPYVIGMELFWATTPSGSDTDYLRGNNGITTTDSIVTYGTRLRNFSGGFSFPDENLEGFAPSTSGFFGPNFLFSAAPVPEPESCALMLAGLGVLTVFARRRVH